MGMCKTWCPTTACNAAACDVPWLMCRRFACSHERPASHSSHLLGEVFAHVAPSDHQVCYAAERIWHGLDQILGIDKAYSVPMQLLMNQLIDSLILISCRVVIALGHSCSGVCPRAPSKMCGQQLLAMRATSPSISLCSVCTSWTTLKG